MAERRHILRSRVLLAGKIELAGGGVIDCTLRDRSEGGARLQVATTTGTSSEFVLLVGQDGERIPARVMWRKANELGVVLG